MTPEMQCYVNELQRLLDKIRDGIESMDASRLNDRPPAADANSPYVIATHTMGNLEAWVLGIVCQQRIDRDRPAEFASSGPDAAAILERAQELRGVFEQALGALPKGALDEQREPDQQHWGIGLPSRLSVREALMETIEHAAIHVGELQLTHSMLNVGSKG